MNDCVHDVVATTAARVATGTCVTAVRPPLLTTSLAAIASHKTIQDGDKIEKKVNDGGGREKDFCYYDRQANGHRHVFLGVCMCAHVCERPSGPAPQAFALCYRFVAAAYAVAAAVDSADESTSLAI